MANSFQLCKPLLLQLRISEDECGNEASVHWGRTIQSSDYGVDTGLYSISRLFVVSDYMYTAHSLSVKAKDL